MTAASTEPTFDRARHLLFACIGLLHGPLVMHAGELLALFVSTFPWTLELHTLTIVIPLCFVALVAWLAFAVFPTNSGVTVVPRRWADVGLLVIVACVIQELVVIVVLCRAPASVIKQLAAANASYTGPLGELLFGWLVLAALLSATAEELVHRALLLRALEGYMNPWLALVLHAVVFELVHVFVYGLGFSGGTWFVGALILGHAFQRTRSLAVPVLMHAGHDIGVTTLVWVLAR